jgi:hypothetical protein
MTFSYRSRRTLVRQTAILGSVLSFGGLAGCLDDVPGSDPDETDDGGTPVTDAVDLRPGMEIGMGFTGFGGTTSLSEIDPDEPGGGRLVTVDAVAPGEEVALSWRGTVERERTPEASPTVGVGEEPPSPEVVLVEETGSVTATGLDDAHRTFFPMFWEQGETTTDTSAIWLSEEAFQELTETRQTAWNADVLTRISWVGTEVQERIDSAVENVDEVVLEAEADTVDFELVVDSQPTTVQAIEAYDSFGNEYIIIENETNPLVVKFTYNAVSVGVTGFDTGLWSLIKAVFSGYQVVSLDTP